ncbi:mitochondrial signal peptide peptidase SppA (protease IV) [Andalucia godoyi]|uniref:Mitochondrial signal peptide peptidase SppA (Protease IV) n=1 Tax=Andalucia godoyi TaxID=505711 RepID=A0A8K0AJG4_ANDGO|nr:mitochondrial signal peptide peptidase SppA (protease IV) [Andalucia godoyi]|eukprot:ANDGO_01045.mRNA.1 mitochondrial signal peptide peptidase SppA (protease IV)
MFGRLSKILVGGAIVTGFAGQYYAKRQKEEYESRPCLLEVDLTATFVETRPTNPIKRMMSAKNPAFADLLYALNSASLDKSIELVILRVGPCSLGLAQIHEVREAISKLKAERKKVVAVCDSMDSTRSYYLASAASEISGSEKGDFVVNGFAVESLFSKRLLDRLGIDVHVEKRKEFKSAMDMISESEMTEPVRHNLESLLVSFANHVSESISADRDVDVSLVQKVMGQGYLNMMESHEKGLVDRTEPSFVTAENWTLIMKKNGRKHARMSLARYLKKLNRIDSKKFTETGAASRYWICSDPRLLVANDFWTAFKFGKDDEKAKSAEDAKKNSAGRIAVMTLSGAIMRDVDERNPSQYISDVAVSKALLDAAKDVSISAVVMRVDSPGGSYIASENIAAAMRRVRAEGKPIVLQMGNVCASGGYYLAAESDYVIAAPLTITGSIGVIATKFAIASALGLHDINVARVQTHENAAAFESVMFPLSPVQKSMLKNRIDEIYGDFVQHVARGRKLPLAQVEAFAKGRVWTGEQGLHLGLVDAFGDLYSAIQIAKDRALKPTATPVAFPYPKNPVQVFLEELTGEDAGSGELSRPLGAWIREAILDDLEQSSAVARVISRHAHLYEREAVLAYCEDVDLNKFT